jgi:hypothetical protein
MNDTDKGWRELEPRKENFSLTELTLEVFNAVDHSTNAMSCGLDQWYENERRTIRDRIPSIFK